MSKKTLSFLATQIMRHAPSLSLVFKHKIIRYMVVGGSAYVIEMTSLYILRYVLGLSALVAVAISFWIGFVAAFTLQKVITFKNYDRGIASISKQILGYSTLVAFNYAFTLLAVNLLQTTLNVMAIRTLTIATITLWNFYIYGKLFRQKTNE